MICLTGDTHGDFRRFSTRHFPIQRELTREDYVIILGDFGGLWDDSRRDRYWLDWLEAKPFTTLWVDGNHENFDLLSSIPEEDWMGGRVQRIRPHILHLCRGHVFRLDEVSFFVMGGAQSHDGPILSADDLHRRHVLTRQRTPFRVEGRSWWSRELPTREELRLGLDTLAWEDWQVDAVLTHCAPTDLQQRLFPTYPVNALTDFLATVRERLNYGCWYCGHYHQDLSLPTETFRFLSEEIIPLTMDKKGHNHE